jgi:hypothetical protein
MPSSGRFFRLGQRVRRHSWFASALVFIVATSVLAAPTIGPVKRLSPPTPGSDPWATVLPLAKATDQPLREPRGLRAGGFIVFPRIEIEEKYDDNIFATKNNRESDFVTVSLSFSREAQDRSETEDTGSRHPRGSTSTAIAWSSASNRAFVPDVGLSDAVRPAGLPRPQFRCSNQ